MPLNPTLLKIIKIDSGNGLVLSGNKPLPHPMLTQLYQHMALSGHNELRWYFFLQNTDLIHPIPHPYHLNGNIVILKKCSSLSKGQCLVWSVIKILSTRQHFQFRDDKLWGVFCELNGCSMFSLRHCCEVCDILIYKPCDNETEWHETDMMCVGCHRACIWLCMGIPAYVFAFFRSGAHITGDCPS